MRAHGDHTALSVSFMDLLVNTTPITVDPKSLRLLSQHCIDPGRYHRHISRWLKYFPPKQLLFIDGGKLVNRPAEVMESVQTFLNVDTLDYKKALR